MTKKPDFTHRPRDWFDCADAYRRIEAAEIAMFATRSIVSGHMSPDADAGHIQRHVELQRKRLLFTDRQPGGNYMGWPCEPRTVASRLPIWC
jgi:hypothetical protein